MIFFSTILLNKIFSSKHSLYQYSSKYNSLLEIDTYIIYTITWHLNVHTGNQDRAYRIIKRKKTVNKKIIKEKNISMKANHRLFNMTGKKKEKMTILTEFEPNHRLFQLYTIVLSPENRNRNYSSKGNILLTRINHWTCINVTVTTCFLFSLAK